MNEMLVYLPGGERTTSVQHYEAAVGHPHPLGANLCEDGVNFSIFSENATGVELLLFADPTEIEPFQTIALDPLMNKTYRFWHVLVLGLQPGIGYAYRIDGPFEPHNQGNRFNRNKVVIDPYARGNSAMLWNRGSACGPDDNLATSMRSVVIQTDGYDWEGDQPLHRPMNETIIYELHVGGFTRSPSSGSERPGTFLALADKIPYLQSLGITAVELLPVFGFDPTDMDRLNPITGLPLMNYWGYGTVSFFAPHHAYCINPEEGTHLREFRDMIKAFHRAGIEVILDVVFNHTSEGNENGPTISFKGIDNHVYYYLEAQDRQYYRNYSGCGNTLSCNHPLVEKLILECLEFWVRDMHVDGFRFDEASILARNEDGDPIPHPPVLWHIELSETLADTKIIAEAWDAAGLYQIGYFPGYRWAEWNGRYRDDLRRFVRGDPGLVGVVASRIAGSADIYGSSGHLPLNSLNFITCHDGFTLNDLVTYSAKHNEANGEGNRDGIADNLSANNGIEGPTDDAACILLRERQGKNFATILLLSQGVPMLLGGDEVQRTQQGNNNAYCQDNAISWFDWTLPEKHPTMLRFFKQVIAFRKRHTTLQRSQYLTGATMARGLKDIDWHGCWLHCPGWFDPTSCVLAFTLGGTEDAADLHVMLNMDGKDLSFDIPPVGGRVWLRAIDTSLPSPADIANPGQELLVTTATYRVSSHSVVVLISQAT